MLKAAGFGSLLKKINKLHSFFSLSVIHSKNAEYSYSYNTQTFRECLVLCGGVEDWDSGDGAAFDSESGFAD